MTNQRPAVYISFLLTLSIFCVFLFAGENKTVIKQDTVISFNTEIPAGSIWIIKPGVRLLFEGYRTFIVRGCIIAEGTAGAPIVFKAVDRPTASRERPSWNGIEIVGKEAIGRFRQCRFEGAYRNLVWEACPSFDSCVFSGNHYGLYCAKKAAPHVKNCRVNRNVYGIAADFAYPLLLDNTISENVIGLYLQLCSEAIAGKNTIVGNETNIRIEDAFGTNPASLSLQNLWDLMQQLY